MAEIVEPLEKSRHRWLPLGLVIFAVVVGAVVLALCSARYGTRTATIDDIATNPARLAATKARLNVVSTELNSLPAFPGTSTEPARQTSCTIDSGDLFQPRVSRQWRVPNRAAERVERVIRTDLAKRGWTFEATPSQAGARRTSFASSKGWTAVGILYTSEEDHLVALEAVISDAPPCRLGTPGN